MESTLKAKFEQKDFLNLCKSHKVDKLYLFGSGTTDQYTPGKSDVDILLSLKVEDPLEKGELLLSFWNKVEDVFEMKVDLLTNESLNNPYLKTCIENTKQLIYDGEREEILI